MRDFGIRTYKWDASYKPFLLSLRDTCRRRGKKIINVRDCILFKGNGIFQKQQAEIHMDLKSLMKVCTNSAQEQAIKKIPPCIMGSKYDISSLIDRY